MISEPPVTPRVAANRRNAQASTGPRTTQGKARSSQNSASLGLFSARAFVRPDEAIEYEQLRAGLSAELAPATLLELAHATEILNSMWRLRRCAAVEASLAEDASPTEPTAPDPMADPSALPTQNAIDRARAHAGNTLRRSTTELRRLQTERLLQSEFGSNKGLASHKEAAGTRVSEARRAVILRNLDGLSTFASLLQASETTARMDLFPPKAEAAITKRSHAGPANPAANEAPAAEP